jgi:hypothetical protein
MAPPSSCGSSDVARADYSLTVSVFSPTYALAIARWNLPFCARFTSPLNLFQHCLRPSLTAKNRYCEPPANPKRQSPASSINRLHADSFLTVPLAEVVSDNHFRF